jgi:hypothetical protein
MTKILRKASTKEDLLIASLDWVKIEKGCLQPQLDTLIEVYVTYYGAGGNYYAREFFLYNNESAFIPIAPKTTYTYWRYASPPPTEI